MSNDARQVFSESIITASLALSITSGILSVIGSITIIVVMLRSPKRLRSTYRRLVFGMSCMDILFSLSYVAAGLPAPKDMVYSTTRNSIGNVATCNIQGFINYYGLIGSLLYACMLSIYFVMVVVYSRREHYIQKKIEPLFHALSILIPFGSGVFLMATNNFNDGGNLCFIQEFPFNCSNTDGKVECTRGKHASQYFWYFEIIPVALIALTIIACMARLSYSVRKQLKKMEKYGAREFVANVQKKRRSIVSSTSFSTRAQPQIRQIGRNASRKSRTEIKEVYTQAALYVLVLALTFIFALIWQIVGQHSWLFLIQMTCVPLLGFFNFFIFIRPRVVITRQSKPELSLFRVFITAIISKEITAPSRRGFSARRRSQAGSLVAKDAYAVRMMEEELREEDEDGPDYGLEGMKTGPLSNVTLKLKELGSNSSAGTSNVIGDAGVGLFTTTEPNNTRRPEILGNNSSTNSHEVQEIDEPSLKKMKLGDSI